MMLQTSGRLTRIASKPQTRPDCSVEFGVPTSYIVAPSYNLTPHAGPRLADWHKPLRVASGRHLGEFWFEFVPVYGCCWEPISRLLWLFYVRLAYWFASVRMRNSQFNGDGMLVYACSCACPYMCRILLGCLTYQNKQTSICGPSEGRTASHPKLSVDVDEAR